ncbi:LOW QUALITY PROTEIN: hypothetical protein PHMEG_0006998 [Phytophthora megakarya]|uniref:Uncharacterized protein n=1 Tax=Phytophthora megakarya TaxID=4795 RepID=A0A225WMH1_9STRA|nr:LOW QUALITY PROTEIN: hypothetical protein PHMEG_0006998 [Phytophthora megakarya]
MENKFREDYGSQHSAKATPTGAGSAIVSSVYGVARVPQPIFALRKEYVEATEEHCKDGKEDLSAVLKNIKSSLDDDRLTTLYEASWGISKEALTDKFLLKKVRKMSMGTSNVQPQVIDYFLSCNKVIMKYGISSFFEGEKGTKKKCKLLVNSLPVVLKEKVTKELDYGSPDAETSILKLSKVVTSKLSRIELVSRETDNSQNKVTRAPTTPDKRPKKTAAREVEKIGDSGKHPSQKGAPKDGCFNCDGEQYFSNCPTATKKDRKRLNTKLSKMGPCRGRTRLIVLEDCFSVAFCADSGADRSGMSMSVYKEFVKICPECWDCCSCGVFDCSGDTDEFLLGNDMSKMLGIYLETQLDLFVANALQTDEDDAFDDRDEPRIGGSIGLNDDLKVAAQIWGAMENGFPKELVGKLHRIATRFDIWWLKLGDVLPARVPPMKIRLKPEAQPYRCEARCYPPESRWPCPVLPVRKSGGDFRQTADYKPVIAPIGAVVGVMPDLHVDLVVVKGAKFFRHVRLSERIFSRFTYDYQ